MNHRPTRAYIDLQALRHNLALIKQHAPESRLMAIIKANGYGHGICKVAQQLSNADGFGVTSIDEALLLRQRGFLHRIVLLEGVFSPLELPIVIQNRLDIVVHCQEQIEWLLEYERHIHQLNVWVKIDTGMHRLGFHPDAVDSVVKQFQKYEKQFHLHFMSHMACADERGALANKFNRKQVKCFEEVCKAHDYPKSLANSAAIFNLNQTHYEWVRPGISLYGCGEFKKSVRNQLRPVMRFESEVLTLRWIQEGESVGYGQRWQASRDTLLAVIGVGYGDGYPRHAKDGTPVLIHNTRVPLVGRVSMDMITVDVTDIADKVYPGDKAILWGDKALSADEVAACSDTISYELLCGITSRVPILEVRR